jgi:hypothetical protein
MYCPECQSEYRQGFTRCADCDVDLVYGLETTASAANVGDDFRVIWRSVDQQSCVSVCYQLQDLGISYKVAETPGALGPNMRIAKRFELAVSSADCERAKSALGIEEDPPATLSEAEWQAMEEPEGPDQRQEPGAAEQEGPHDLDERAVEASFADMQARRDAFFRFWYPEDATVQIWSREGAEDISGAIEMALKENLIHCRLDVDSGSCKVFVLPQDETRARDIVREITDGVPPE